MYGGIGGKVVRWEQYFTSFYARSSFYSTTTTTNTTSATNAVNFF